MEYFKFKECNTVFAEYQPEYESLPALKLDTEDGQVVTCWKFSFKERIKILFGGKLWLSMLTFNKPLTPIFLSINRKEHFKVNGE